MLPTLLVIPFTFLSTPSVGRATRRRVDPALPGEISIHALRGEGDRRRSRPSSRRWKFLSTPSVGRATHVSHLLNGI